MIGRVANINSQRIRHRRKPTPDAIIATMKSPTYWHIAIGHIFYLIIIQYLSKWLFVPERMSRLIVNGMGFYS